MFEVNNKDTRTYFTPWYSVFIVNFEHVIAVWVTVNVNYKVLRVHYVYDHLFKTKSFFL